jgi:ankyrin repeat protein
VRALLTPPCNASSRALLAGDTSPLYLASQRGHVRAAAALLDAGAEPNFVMPRGVHSTQLITPRAGEEPPMGAGGFYPERNTERGNGATALHAAAENGHHAMVELVTSTCRLGSKVADESPLCIW